MLLDRIVTCDGRYFLQNFLDTLRDLQRFSCRPPLQKNFRALVRPHNDGVNVDDHKGINRHSFSIRMTMQIQEPHRRSPFGLGGTLHSIDFVAFRVSTAASGQRPDQPTQRGCNVADSEAVSNEAHQIPHFLNAAQTACAAPSEESSLDAAARKPIGSVTAFSRKVNLNDF